MKTPAFDMGELTQLIDAIRDDFITAEQRMRLEEILSEDEDARRYYRRAMRLHGYLEQMAGMPTTLAGPAPDLEESLEDDLQPHHERVQDVRQDVIQLGRGRRVIYACATAAALLITTGLVALWLSPDPLGLPLTPHEKRRHQNIVEQLHELELAREAIETVKARRRPRPKPAAPIPEAPTRAIAQQEAEEANEAVRFIDARRRFVMRQLRMFDGRAPLPDNLDAEEFDPDDPDTSTEPAVAGTGPVEVGRVLAVEGGKAGVLIREADEGSQRLELTSDLKLLSGDRIETAQRKDVPCTSVRLNGGATIDLDCATSIEVLGRDNVRFHTGRLYAHIAVPYSKDSYPEEGPPFSLQTEAGRFLTHDLQAELSLSSHEVLNKDLSARVDGGKVHLVNRKGHVVGRKGQELQVRKNARPSRTNGFSRPIWRGRSLTNPGLPVGKGNPVVLSHGNGDKSFSVEYALALAHTGEIDLRGIQIVHNTFDPQGERRQVVAATWRTITKEVARLRTTGLRFTPNPVIGALCGLKPPASGRYQDVVPERSPAVDQLLAEARKVTPDRPLVVITSGSLTDLASAWLIDHSVAGRIVVVTDAKPDMWKHDPWAFRIVLEEYRCVSVHLDIPANTLPSAGLRGTRWDSIAGHTRVLNQDFSRFACVTVSGFVRSVERARFVCGPPEQPGRFRFEPDPKGRTWLAGRPDPARMKREFEETFLNGPNTP